MGSLLPGTNPVTDGPLSAKNPATDGQSWGDHGFSAFISKAEVRPLPAGYRCPRLHPAREYNDDVAIDSYRPAPFLLDGKQRKGILEAFQGCPDMAVHAKRALRERFPLAQDTPLPAETKASADFV